MRPWHLQYLACHLSRQQGGLNLTAFVNHIVTQHHLLLDGTLCWDRHAMEHKEGKGVLIIS